jgi:Dolichyl-phosphate-mannose-protein mannosyltransferase
MKSKRGKSAGGAPRRAHGAVILPGVILFVALVFRIVSLTTFDTLFDEQITRDVVTGIWRGEWSNNWKYTVSAKNYRDDQYNFSSYLYADALTAGAAGQLDAFLSDGKPDFVFWSRLFSAVTGTLAVYLFYLVARRLFPPGTAIAAMALMAAMPLLVQDSHYARPEAFVTALTGAAYLLLLQFDSHRDRLRYLGCSAFCFGVLIACKVSLIPMAAIPVLFLASQPDRRLLMWGSGMCAACTLLGIFIGVPDAFFHPAAYWHGVQFLRHQYAEGRPPHAAADGTSVTLTALYFWQTTGLLLVFSLAGALVLARRRQFLLLAAIGGPVAFYLAYFSLQRAFFERNLSHVAPLMSILAAVALLALCETLPLPVRSTALVALMALTVAPALWVSGKLVFIAMRASPEQRALNYESSLMTTVGKIGGTMPLFTDGQFNYLMQLAATLDQDALLRVPDYHDAFTKKHLEELERRTNWREVGYFPSVFEGFDVNTMIAYHSVSFRYLFVRAAPPAP